MLTLSDGPLITTFVAVARSGSFSLAASALRISKSVVSARIRTLERRAAVPLFERTTRMVRLTDAGQALLDASVQVDDVLHQVSEGLELSAKAPVGRLRIATTHDLAATLVSLAVARFVARYPHVTAEIIADDRAHDPVEAGVDLAVRLGVVRDAAYSLHRLGASDELVVAAPSLAGRLSAATSPRDLADAPWVRHALVVKSRLRFTTADGGSEVITPTVRAEADTGLAVLGLLLAGAGVGVLPAYMVREHLITGRLIRLVPPWVWRRVWLYVLAQPRPQLRTIHRDFIATMREQVALDVARWA